MTEMSALAATTVSGVLAVNALTGSELDDCVTDVGALDDDELDADVLNADTGDDALDLIKLAFNKLDCINTPGVSPIKTSPLSETSDVISAASSICFLFPRKLTTAVNSGAAPFETLGQHPPGVPGDLSSSRSWVTSQSQIHKEVRKTKGSSKYTGKPVHKVRQDETTNIMQTGVTFS